jgi:hypothetical protein
VNGVDDLLELGELVLRGLPRVVGARDQDPHAIDIEDLDDVDFAGPDATGSLGGRAQPITR